MNDLPISLWHIMHNIKTPCFESSIDSIMNFLLSSIFPLFLTFRVLAHYYVLKQINFNDLKIEELSAFASLIKKNSNAYSQWFSNATNLWEEHQIKLKNMVFIMHSNDSSATDCDEVPDSELTSISACALAASNH